MVVAEGWSIAHAPTLSKLQNLERMGNTVRITILRNPIERALSRYWFEGRWQLFVKDRSPDTAMSFHMWLGRDNCGPGKERSGRLWNCMENYYVKTFSGWIGNSMCEGDFGCVGGVGPVQVDTAKSVLSNRFDLVLINEWLSSKPQIRLLAKVLCFEFDELTGSLPLRSLTGTPNAQIREVPSFKPKRPAGGHSKERPDKWVPEPEELLHLQSVNELDLNLFHWAEEQTRKKIMSMVSSNNLNLKEEIDALPHAHFTSDRVYCSNC
jgi:hypothetical protein